VAWSNLLSFRLSTGVIFLCLFLLAWVTVSRSQAQVNADSSTLLLTTRIGYSQTDFDWSIAGDIDGKNPNIYSELIWKNLGGITVGADIAWQFYRRVYLRVSFDYTTIQSGSVTDSDFASDDRQDRTFFADLDADEGYNFNFVPRIGYRFTLSNYFAITPYAGFTVSRQHLTVRDNDESQFDGLNSSYDVSWRGWNAGIEGTLFLSRQILLLGSVAYHQMKFRGEGNWNLVETFEHPVSYRQRANGYAIETRLNVQYQLTARWSVDIGVNVSWWKTAKGVDTLFLTSGQEPQTQFNGAARRDWSTFGAVTFRL
jgi:hypothetical protein